MGWTIMGNWAAIYSVNRGVWILAFSSSGDSGAEDYGAGA